MLENSNTVHRTTNLIQQLIKRRKYSYHTKVPSLIVSNYNAFVSLYLP